VAIPLRTAPLSSPPRSRNAIMTAEGHP